MRTTIAGFVCVAFFSVLLQGAQAQVANLESPVADTKLTTSGDLLRGFSDDELQTMRRKIPEQAEPELGAARPRLVTVSGAVFEDRNENGTRDDGERGLADVSVSDGERVVRTKKDGSFQFQIRFDENPHHRFVVVTRPTGFRPTQAFFERIPVDEARVEYEVDFGLVRDPASAMREFWFMTASDSQFTNIEQMIPTAKDYAQVTSAPEIPRFGKPAFLATAGDLTMNGSQYEWTWPTSSAGSRRSRFMRASVWARWQLPRPALHGQLRAADRAAVLLVGLRRRALHPACVRDRLPSHAGS